MKLTGLSSIILVFVLLFVWGLYDSPFSEATRDELRIDAEYANGILTASGILFGIWTILIEKKPDGDTAEEIRVNKWIKKYIVGFGFFWSFLFLIISVFILMLTALDFYSTRWSLLVSTISFMLNAFFLFTTLYSRELVVPKITKN